MAKMFFAGIPLEGSGSRPLDADLYGAEQQGVDQENLSATGNLNIGNLIQYDDHAQRYLSGSSMDNDERTSQMPQAKGGAPAMPESMNPSRISQPESNDQPAVHNTAFANPEVQNLSKSSVQNQQSPAPVAPEPGPASTSTGPLQTSTNTRTVTNNGGEDNDITNSYNTYNTTYNNITNNSIENNNTWNTSIFNNNSIIHDIDIGDIILGGPGGGITTNIFNTVNTLISNETNLLSDITNNTITTTIQNITGDILSPIINIGGNGGDINILSNILNNNVLDVGGLLNGSILSGNGPAVLPARRGATCRHLLPPAPASPCAPRVMRERI